MKTLLLIHGPNLNRLGARPSRHYGTLTLAQLEEACREKAKTLGFELKTFQSNHPGELIDFLQTNPADAILINPGALSHAGHALHDALLDTQTPCIEVHLSQISARESWRRTSVTAAACLTQIQGKGLQGYLEALELFAKPLNAVIGIPLDQSPSPEFHNAKYRELGLPHVMVKMASEDIFSLVERIRRQKMELVAVTMPHKESILPLLDHLDPLAKEIGAVNTVLQINDQLHGFNTDFHGLASALKTHELKDKKVLLIGAGGAAKAAAHFLKQQGAHLTISNRNSQAAEELAKKYGTQTLPFSEAPIGFDLILNATPAKLQHASTPVLSLSPQTPFGRAMFEAQALEQIRLWQASKNPHEPT